MTKSIDIVECFGCRAPTRITARNAVEIMQSGYAISNGCSILCEACREAIKLANEASLLRVEMDERARTSRRSNPWVGE